MPTASAARRIRHELAQLAASEQRAVLSPAFKQPMAALLPEDPPLPMATGPERAAAWAWVLNDLPAPEIARLLPEEVRPVDAPGWIGTGELLSRLADLLAEAGLSPSDSILKRVCGEDAERWRQIAAVHKAYLKHLAEHGRCDPNAQRLERIARGERPESLRAVVLACLPDLPKAAELYASALARQGVEVTILVWTPQELPGALDPWGRPVPKDWTQRNNSLRSDQIFPANTPATEVEEVLDYLSQGEPSDDFGLVLADPALAAAFEPAILRRGGQPFQPEGENLALTSPGLTALRWVQWKRSGRLRDLRKLLHLPAMAKWLGRESGLKISESIRACDYLIAEVLLEDRSQAETFLAQQVPETRHAWKRAEASKLLGALAGADSWSAEEVLRKVYASQSADSANAGRVLELCRELQSSPLLQHWPEAFESSLARALGQARTFDYSQPGDLELTGWLEAPWMPCKRLAVAGVLQGRLPASVHDHPFLPDSRRKELGLTDNEARLARDAYLLHCLLQTRPPEDFRCSFSKFQSNGEAALPSSLLMRCADHELPERIQLLFGNAHERPAAGRSRSSMKWKLPPELQSSPTAVRATDFSKYLRCPLRFYFSQVLRWDKFDSELREMDARSFGSLLHNVLEEYGRTSKDESDPVRIRRILEELLEESVRRQFGPSPSPAVRVQLESIKVRLRAFAELQARERANGWRIIDVERSLKPDDENPIHIGPLPLAATIDRIEERDDGTIRIADYKSFPKAKTFHDVHFGPVSRVESIPEAEVTVDGKQKSWVDLQLPVYERIAEEWFPGRPIITALIMLPADPAYTDVEPFPLTDELRDSARDCATAIAERISKGIFWPAHPFRQTWDDSLAPLFLNGDPKLCFDKETVTFLKGTTV